ncbi:MAG: hypothetical protein WCT85_01815 [Parachlamydiales bacterium]|jgi:hypothetical protein
MSVEPKKYLAYILDGEFQWDEIRAEETPELFIDAAEEIDDQVQALANKILLQRFDVSQNKSAEEKILIQADFDAKNSGSINEMFNRLQDCLAENKKELDEIADLFAPDKFDITKARAKKPTFVKMQKDIGTLLEKTISLAKKITERASAYGFDEDTNKYKEKFNVILKLTLALETKWKEVNLKYEEFCPDFSITRIMQSWGSFFYDMTNKVSTAVKSVFVWEKSEKAIQEESEIEKLRQQAPVPKNSPRNPKEARKTLLASEIAKQNRLIEQYQKEVKEIDLELEKLNFLLGHLEQAREKIESSWFFKELTDKDFEELRLALYSADVILQNPESFSKKNVNIPYIKSLEHSIKDQISRIDRSQEKFTELKLNREEKLKELRALQRNS